MGGIWGIGETLSPTPSVVPSPVSKGAPCQGGYGVYIYHWKICAPFCFGRRHPRGELGGRRAACDARG